MNSNTESAKRLQSSNDETENGKNIIATTTNRTPSLDLMMVQTMVLLALTFTGGCGDGNSLTPVEKAEAKAPVKKERSFH